MIPKGLVQLNCFEDLVPLRSYWQLDAMEQMKSVLTISMFS